MIASRPISLIIPSYNEASRMGNVLSVVCTSPAIDEIIVVDDGSTDNTKEVLAKYPQITVITQVQNRGKTYAVMCGIQKARNDLVMLIDADLIGLTHETLSALARPVFEGKAEMSLSLRQNSLGIYKMLGIDFFSGERVFNRNMLGDIQKLAELPKFGLETYMNSLVIQRSAPIAVVKWESVSHYRKSEKMGTVQGTLKEMAMVSEVVRTVPLFRLLSDMRKLRRLRVSI